MEGCTETERKILDMWPKFEDGGYVMLGDEVAYDYHEDERVGNVVAIRFPDKRPFKHTFALDMEDNGRFTEARYIIGSKVKRPAPKVLDFDGVPIREGDTVWYRSLCGTGSMRKATVTGFDENDLDVKLATLKDEAGKIWHVKPKYITHTRPDSWERLEKDAESIRQIIACNFGDFSPSDFKQSGDSLQDCVIDLIRRAKALADKGAGQ